MKKTVKTGKLISNFDQLFSHFSEDEILNVRSLISIRGGDGADNGNGTTPPPPPPPPPLP
jgi:hypothetical protein